PAGKKNTAGFVANDHHRTFLRNVQIVQPAAFLNWQIANLIEIRGNSHELAAALEIITERADIIARDYRRDQLYIRTLGGNVLVIPISEVILAEAGETAVHGGNASAPDEQHILAQLVELFLIAGAETFPQSHQQQQRAHSPRDSEHGEKRAQLMRPKGAKG